MDQYDFCVSLLCVAILAVSRPISSGSIKKRNGPVAVEMGDTGREGEEKEKKDHKGEREYGRKGEKKRKNEHIVRNYRRTCAAARSSCDVTLDILTARRVGRGR